MRGKRKKEKKLPPGATFRIASSLLLKREEGRGEEKTFAEVKDKKGRKEKLHLLFFAAKKDRKIARCAGPPFCYSPSRRRRRCQCHQVRRRREYVFIYLHLSGVAAS